MTGILMYDHEAVVLAIKTILLKNPSTHLHRIAICLNIERHTITRALKSKGLSFRRLRAEMIVEAVETLLTKCPLRSQKEIAYLLGFRSQSAFSHFKKRHGS